MFLENCKIATKLFFEPVTKCYETNKTRPKNVLFLQGILIIGILGIVVWEVGKRIV